MLALLNIIPILMIVIGSLNKENCKVNSNIPVWLIVAGSCALVRSAINFAYRFRVKPPLISLKTREFQDLQNRARPLLVRLFESLLSVFIVIWYAFFSVFVYL